MAFAVSRFYPLDTTNRILYLDSQKRKADCAKFPHAVGISGFELNHKWETMVAQGYITKRLGEEKRGGAGRGQGRKPIPDPISTVKLKIPHTVHTKLSEHLVLLRRRSGKAIKMQEYVAQLIMDADVNRLAPLVKDRRSEPVWLTKVVRDDPAWLHIFEPASDRLTLLTKQLDAVQTDIQPTRSLVLAAIILLAVGEQQ